jgi:hypothetical protein
MWKSLEKWATPELTVQRGSPTSTKETLRSHGRLETRPTEAPEATGSVSRALCARRPRW